jgi:elongation factor Ts
VIKSAQVVVHPSRIAFHLIGWNKVVDAHIGKDVAMQVAAMSPVAIDKADVPASIIEKEKEIGREQARNEGKPDNMLDRIAEGKLNKFLRKRTAQPEFARTTPDRRQYLQGQDKDLTVTGFLRFSLFQ